MAESLNTTKNILEVDTSASVLDSDSVFINKDGKLQQTQISKIVETKIDKTVSKENFAADAKVVNDKFKQVDSNLQKNIPTALKTFINEVTATPTAYGNAIVKKIEGFIRQETTTGAQLFDSSSLTAYNEATFSVLNGGKDVKVTGRKTSESAKSSVIYQIKSALFELMKGKTLYVYVNHDAENGWFEFGVQSESTGWTYKQVTNKQWTEVNVPSDLKNTSIALIPNAKTEENITATFKDIKIGLTQFETWEPYTGGESAPSPDYLQTIHGVGDMGFFDGELTSGLISTSTGETTPDNTAVTTNKIPCNPNDVVKVKYDGESAYIHFSYYREDGTFIRKEATSLNPAEKTVPSDCKYFRISVQGKSSFPVSSAKHIIVTINGMYAICVRSHSPNLLDIRGKTGGSAARASVLGETVQITTLEGSGSAPGVFFYLGSITNFLGKRIYIKADKMESTHSAEGKASCRMVIRSVKGGTSVQSYGIYQDTKAGTWMQSAEIPADLDLSTVTELCLQMYVGDGTTQVAVGKTASFENVMVCWEKTEEYHPYQSETTYIPISYPIFDGDKLIKRNNEYKILRKKKLAVFDGDESWSKATGNESAGLNNFVTTTDGKLEPGYCDKFKSQNTAISETTEEGILFQSLAIYVRIKSSKVTDASGFKTWLQSNPITCVYTLANPIEEELTPEAQKAIHSIMACDEQTTIEIVGVPTDAEVQNQFLLPRNVDGALNTTAFATSKRNEVILNEFVEQNLDSRINKLEIDNTALSEQTIIIE